MFRIFYFCLFYILAPEATAKTASVKKVEQSEQREDEGVNQYSGDALVIFWVKWPLRCSSKTMPVLLRFVFFCSPWPIFVFYLFSSHFYLTRLVSLRLRIFFSREIWPRQSAAKTTKQQAKHNSGAVEFAIREKSESKRENHLWVSCTTRQTKTTDIRETLPPGPSLWI